MKKGILILLGFILLSIHACKTGEGSNTGTFVSGADYVQIVLFHLEQRCESCIAVELETQNLLEAEYAEEVQSGRIRFISLNFQSENGKQAARLLKASGQTLYVVQGDNISDLTSAAFMYASTHPEFYLDALREALNTYLD